MPIVELQDGRRLEFKNTPTQQDVDMAVNQLGQAVPQGQEQQQVQGYAMPTLTKAQFEPIVTSDAKSPLSILERMKLSFADDKGRERYLRDKFNVVERLPNGKFAVGNNPNEVTPIDPEGMFNDVIGDIADVVSELPVIAGQIAGATGGATLGAGAGGIGAVPGGIAGGAAGAALGETARETIGHAMGVRESNLRDEAVNVAVAGTFGAAGEALIPASKFVGGVIKSKLTKALGEEAATIAAKQRIPIEETKIAQFTAKLMNIMSNVKEDSVKTAFKYGINNVDTKINNDPNTIIPLVKKVMKHLDDTRFTLGKEVERQKKAFVAAANRAKQKVDVGELVDNLIKDAKELKVITQFDTMNLPSNIPNKEDIHIVKTLLKSLGILDPKTGMIVRQIGKNGKTVLNISAKDAIDTIKVYGQRFDRASDNVQGLLHKFLGLDDSLRTPGLRHRTRDLAGKLGLTRYSEALDDFGNFAGLRSQLKQLNPDNPAGIETFINNLENLPTWSRKEVLQKLNKYVETTVGKGKEGTGFLADIEKWNAAQDFKRARPDILRFGFIASAISAITGTPILTNPLLKYGGATLIGTPAGNKLMLKAMAKVSAGVKNLPRTVVGAKRIMDREKEKQLINALISSGMRQGVGVQ